MNIIFTNVKTPRNPVWETEGGPDARDKVFCLSCQEVEEYLPEMSDRAMGEWWWLRTLGHCLLAAEAVYIDGTVYDIGLNVVDTGVGVRPAMWIRLGR